MLRFSTASSTACIFLTAGLSLSHRPRLGSSSISDSP